jgi:hypothetical protein
MKTIRRKYRVDRKEISYIRNTIESYDGMAVVKTLDPHAAHIEILISPGCEHMVLELIDSLSKKEAILFRSFDRN